MTSNWHEDNQNALSHFPELSEIFEHLPNYQVVNEGLQRGGQPTERGFAILKEEGVKTIINLREESEHLAAEEALIKRLGLNYHSLVISPFGFPTNELIHQAISIITDESKQPVFLHCLHGQDRTGMLVGIYRMVVEEWNLQDAYCEMLAMGFHAGFTNLKNTAESYHGKKMPLHEF
ncbi:tyrosine-protein phosphatase [bacterium]|nr:tyrosine-protein phosphatase [bacterium]